MVATAMHRFIPIALLGALSGCQAILGLDEGQKRPEGQGGMASATSASASGSGTATGAQGGGGGAGGGGTGGASIASGSTASSATAGGASTTAVAASSSSSSGSAGGGGGGPVLDVIDDMEAANGLILNKAGRSGAWYTYNDTTGMQTPMAGDPVISELVVPSNPNNPASLRANHTLGSGFVTWGAGMGFDLNNTGIKQVYNVTAFTGITFWAMGTSVVRLKVLVKATVPTLDGGDCTINCGDNHGMSITLTPGWQQYSIPFMSLAQEGWGAPASFDPTTVLSIQFGVSQNVSFDFWIDDISFYN